MLMKRQTLHKPKSSDSKACRVSKVEFKMPMCQIRRKFREMLSESSSLKTYQTGTIPSNLNACLGHFTHLDQESQRT